MAYVWDEEKERMLEAEEKHQKELEEFKKKLAHVSFGRYRLRPNAADSQCWYIVDEENPGEIQGILVVYVDDLLILAP